MGPRLTWPEAQPYSAKRQKSADSDKLNRREGINWKSAAHHATEADVVGGGVDRLRLAGGGAIALAIALGAQVAAALQHTAANLNLRSAWIEAVGFLPAARIGDYAAGTWFHFVDRLRLGIPIAGPLPHVADQVPKAIIVGGVVAHRACPLSQHKRVHDREVGNRGQTPQRHGVEAIELG